MRLKTKIRHARKAIEAQEVLFESIKEELESKISFEFIVTFIPGDGICIIRENGSYTGMSIYDVLDIIEDKGEVTLDNFSASC